MENQNNNLQELEGLRQQVAEFKNRMEQQEIVNQKLLNTAMNGHISWIRTMNIWAGPIGLTLMPFFMAYFRSVGCSWALMIFLLLVLIGETVFNLWNVSTIRDKHLAAQDVISVQQRLIAYKRREKLQAFIEYPVMILCVIWLYYELLGSIVSSNRLMLVITVGILLATFILFFILYCEMRSLNKAIKDIDEFADKI